MSKHTTFEEIPVGKQFNVVVPDTGHVVEAPWTKTNAGRAESYPIRMDFDRDERVAPVREEYDTNGREY